MLDKIDLSHKASPTIYKKRVPELRAQMLHMQKRCYDAKLPVIVVFEGWGASGRGEMVNFLSQYLEPRAFSLHMVVAERTAERQMPWLWRFWLRIPSYGHLAIFDQSWYRRVLIDRVEDRVRKPEWRRAYEDINDFERALADDGYLLLKFFLHISKKEQARRLKKDAGDPISRGLRDPEDRLQLKKYKSYLKAVEEMLERTETEWGQWTIIEAEDQRYARLKVFDNILARLEDGLRHARKR